MAVRIGTQGVVFIATDVGASSVAGGVPFPFQIPQDTDNITVKMVASVTAGGASAVLQTSDDGGTTYYDIARTSVVSNGVPQWLSATTISAGINPRSLTVGGSILGGTIGTAAASTLGQSQVSGLPILGIQNRIFLIYTGAATASSIVTTVKVNNQSATA